MDLLQRWKVFVLSPTRPDSSVCVLSTLPHNSSTRLVLCSRRLDKRDELCAPFAQPRLEQADQSLDLDALSRNRAADVLQCRKVFLLSRGGRSGTACGTNGARTIWRAASG